MRISLFFIFIFSWFSPALQAQRNGRYVKRYDMFHIKIKGHYHHGNRVGEWVEWNKDGTIKSIAYYNNEGKLDGPYLESSWQEQSGWYRNGERDSTWTISVKNLYGQYVYDSVMKFSGGKPYGEWHTVYKGSQQSSSGYFKNGKRDSIFLKKDAQGRIIVEGHYSANRKTGHWIYQNGLFPYRDEWYSDDSLLQVLLRTHSNQGYDQWTRLELYKHGKKYYEVTATYSAKDVKSGEEMRMVLADGKMENDSVWTKWSKEGIKLSEERYKKGLKSGVSRFYFADGLLYEECYYKDDVKNGPDNIYFKDGRRSSEGNYVNDKKNGRWATYYSSGKLEVEQNFSADALDGTFTEWYENGKKKSEGNYSGGYLDGSYKEWDEQGHLIRNIQYKREDHISKPGININGERNELTEVPPLNYGDPEVFTYAEEMPKFPGGDTEWYKYIQKNIIYPEMEKEAGVQGRVYVSFVVNTDGSISDVKLEKGVSGGPGLNKEAMRVISHMPQWTPGKINGKPVRVKMVLPVNYVIK
ncbi:MAG TPA: TonB family protein [Bacteroidia bacterium]